MIRHCLRAVLPAASALLAVAILAAPLAAQQAKDKVTFRQCWLPRGDYAPIFVAIDKGFMAQEGIEVVKVLNGDGSANTVKLVGAGQFDFGCADGPTMAVGKSKGIPVTSLFMRNQNSPMALVSLRGSGIKHPKDLEGKTFGIFPAGSTHVFYQAVTKANNVDRKKIREVTVGVPYEQYLVQKRVDAVVGYVNAEVQELENKLGGEGTLEIVPGDKYGYEVYGTVMFTSDKLVKEKADLVRRFSRAYKRAVEYTAKNPEEAIDILMKHNPQANRQVMLKQLRADLKYTFFSKDTEKNGVGWQTEEGWRRTQDVLLQYGVTTERVPERQLFTNEFLK